MRVTAAGVLFAFALPVWSADARAREILQHRCWGCHGVAQMSGLDLRSRQAMLKGGSRGPAIVPGDPDHSILCEAIGRRGELKMPPGKEALSPGEVEVIRLWVKAGAAWEAEVTGRSDQEEEPSWWSFRRPKRPPIPAGRKAGWVHNPIDAFILQKLEQNGLAPAPAADRATLIRRVYYDLTGMPPAPEAIESFVNDRAPDAYAKLVDSLLASPRYGEAWAKHWLDLVRYADSGGFQTDVYFRNAWRYRDYVIRAFNDDKPYDRFLQEQIAGDEMWPDNLDLAGTYEISATKLQHLQARIATGLYTFGPEVHESNLDARRLTYEKLTDWVDTTGSVFLGLTFGCARCHDHKFDPITQRDYFRLQAVFAYSAETDVPVVSGMSMRDFSQHYPRLLAVVEARTAYRQFERSVRERLVRAARGRFSAEVVHAYDTPEGKRTEEQKRTAKPLAEAVKTINPDKDLNPEEREQRKALAERIAKAVLEIPEQDAQKVPYEGLFEIPTATVLTHRAPELVPEVQVLQRGDLGHGIEKVEAGLPAFLGSVPVIEPAGGHTIPQARKTLALWLSRPDHPLTARVLVNRVWAWHFGRGIVSTPSDFGRQGQAPSHAELLDWLATEFTSGGWSIKSLHRLILLSNTYQMTSRSANAEAMRKDPENRLLWRMNRRRLEAESLWDSIHTVAGTLNLKMGGRPVVPPLGKDEMDGLASKWQWPVSADPQEQNRRGIYILVRRNFPFPMFEVFDAPDTAASCPRRDVTNVPTQALWMLNNRAAFEQARAFAEKLLGTYGPDPRRFVAEAWVRALGRRPSIGEVREALELVSRLADQHPGEPASEALTKLCLALFNLNEFSYVD